MNNTVLYVGAPPPLTGLCDNEAVIYLFDVVMLPLAFPPAVVP